MGWRGLGRGLGRGVRGVVSRLFEDGCGEG